MRRGTIKKIKFRKPLFEGLKSSEYVFLSPIPPETTSGNVEILFSTKEIQPMIDRLKQLKHLHSITLATSLPSGPHAKGKRRCGCAYSPAWLLVTVGFLAF